MLESRKFAEWQNGVLSILWGVWLLWPYYGAPVPKPIYGTLLHAASHLVWAGLFLLAGGTQLAGLLLCHRRVRRLATFGAFLVWMFAALVIGMEDWRALAFPMSLMCATSAAWGFIRLRRI